MVICGKQLKRLSGTARKDAEQCYQDGKIPQLSMAKGAVLAQAPMERVLGYFQKALSGFFQLVLHSLYDLFECHSLVRRDPRRWQRNLVDFGVFCQHPKFLLLLRAE